MVILTERGFQDPYVLVTPLVPLVSEFVIRDKMLAFSFGRTQAVPFKMITVDHLYASCRPKVALKSSLHFFWGKGLTSRSFWMGWESLITSPLQV